MQVRSAGLVLVHLSQLRNEEQSADPQAIQLALSIRKYRRTRPHVARDDRAQLRIVRRQKVGNLCKLGRIPGESQDRQIGLVDRRVEREIRDQRGMTVEEHGETVLEGDEERRRRTSIRARCKRVVVRTGTNLERNAFQDELIADTRTAELLLLESVSDEPASQRGGSD